MARERDKPLVSTAPRLERVLGKLPRDKVPAGVATASSPAASSAAKLLGVCFGEGNRSAYETVVGLCATRAQVNGCGGG